ncbi:MAG: DUF4062 domain-containing protein [Desulfobulbaceae bacterium]|nr:DUF4062 domain-containing protein [Desulfobulbaceae bacterium]
MAKIKQELKIFVSSPSGIEEEHKRVTNVIKDLNKRLDKFNCLLVAIRFKDIPPSAGKAQEIIDREIGNFDIFLGIMKDRFGTPVFDSQSGSQHEFELAYSSWQEKNEPEIMFYFCDQIDTPKYSEATEQLLKVQKFREEISSRVLHKGYDNPDDFERKLSIDLEEIAISLISTKKEKSFQDKCSKGVCSDNINTIESDQIDGRWASNEVSSSFMFSDEANKYQIYQAKIQTTDGWIKNEQGIEKLTTNFVYLIKDPIRPYDIQIGETRSSRKKVDPQAIPDLENLDQGSVKRMYPFLQVEGYKWIRMILAELSSDPKILDFIYNEDPDPHVKSIAAKNPSASSNLQEKECKFCQCSFLNNRKISSGSEATHIIRNDFPYGPYLHYIAMPATPIHTWEELQFKHIYDMNLTIWKFFCSGIKSGRWIPKPSGLFIGLNSTIRHLVLGTKTRTSAGASIPHIHKQIWGMAPGSVNLGKHLEKLCNAYTGKTSYLEEYLNFLNDENLIIWSDEYVALYIPYGQISTHELQIMIKRPGTTDITKFSNDEILSLSKAEMMAIKLFDEIGIKSFNEIMLTLPFNNTCSDFRSIICFITREVDLAVSELNHLFVVDKHPIESKKIFSIKKDFIIDMVQTSAIDYFNNS